ncbi:hypothetical protein CEXT_265021 [Caerostris extrusa]|uniref:Uncharacterized protein n=1 Tax=Caerostris extrusa TaxID=172846 RepID=A0AAV4NVB1_CAEEX|nr:hypothetical protein CEXT_265021 [Caerostris extrusa]
MGRLGRLKIENIFELDNKLKKFHPVLRSLQQISLIFPPKKTNCGFILLNNSFSPMQSKISRLNEALAIGDPMHRDWRGRSCNRGTIRMDSSPQERKKIEKKKRKEKSEIKLAKEISGAMPSLLHFVQEQ